MNSRQTIRRLAVPVAAVLAVVTALAALAWRPGGGEAEDGIVLFCGAALRPPMDEIIGAFQRRTRVRVRTHYGPSNLLLGQLRLAPDACDLFLPGDEFYIDEARALGLVAQAHPVAWLVPVLLVAPGNPHNITVLADLARPGLRVGLADERSAAVGRIAPTALAKAGLAMEAVRPNVVFSAGTAPELGTAVAMGHIDATLVWETVARRHAPAEVVEIPPEVNHIVPLVIGLSPRGAAKPAAREFAEFLNTDIAREILRAHFLAVEAPAEALSEDL